MPQDAIANHPVWVLLQNFEGLKSSEAFVEVWSDPKYSWIAQRLFDYVAAVNTRLVATPETLRSAHLMGQLHNVLSQVYGEVVNFVGNKNRGHLDNADNYVDQNGYAVLTGIPLHGDASSAEQLARIVGDFSESARGMLAVLAQTADRLREGNDELSKKLESQSATIQELSALVARQQAEAQSTVEALRGKFDLLQAHFEQEFQAERTARKESYELLSTQFKTTAIETVDKISLLRNEAADIVQIVGNIGVTGNYQKTASAEARQADTWRNVTVLFFVLAIGIGGVAVLTADTASLVTTVGRMLFALVVAGVTVYTGRESARHRSNSDRAKRLELELASLGPFIQGLDENRKSELRALLTERYFGQEGEAHEMKTIVDPDKLVDLLREAIKGNRK